MTTNQTIDGVSRKSLEQALKLAAVFDDGGDGADAESARGVVWILRALLDAPAVSLADEGEMPAAQPMGETVEVVARWSDWSMLTLEIDGQHRTYVDTGRPEQSAPVAVVPEGFMLVERGIWTEGQVESAAKCITMLKGVPGMSDRDLAMAAMDAGQCKAPEIVPEPVAVVLPDRDSLRDIIAQAIGGDTYDCVRVWSAWGVGTMSQDDFVPVVEQEARLYEIADACLDEVTRLNTKE